MCVCVCVCARVHHRHPLFKGIGIDTITTYTSQSDAQRSTLQTHQKPVKSHFKVLSMSKRMKISTRVFVHNYLMRPSILKKVKWVLKSDIPSLLCMEARINLWLHYDSTSMVFIHSNSHSSHYFWCSNPARDISRQAVDEISGSPLDLCWIHKCCIMHLLTQDFNGKRVSILKMLCSVHKSQIYDITKGLLSQNGGVWEGTASIAQSRLYADMRKLKLKS